MVAHSATLRQLHLNRWNVGRSVPQTSGVRGSEDEGYDKGLCGADILLMGRMSQAAGAAAGDLRLAMCGAVGGRWGSVTLRLVVVVVGAPPQCLLLGLLHDADEPADAAARHADPLQRSDGTSVDPAAVLGVPVSACVPRRAQSAPAAAAADNHHTREVRQLCRVEPSTRADREAGYRLIGLQGVGESVRERHGVQRMQLRSRSEIRRGGCVGRREYVADGRRVPAARDAVGGRVVRTQRGAQRGGHQLLVPGRYGGVVELARRRRALRGDGG